MKKNLTIIVTAVIALLLCACSSSVISNKEIQEEISAYENFIESGIEIVSYSETKRETNKKENSDFICASVIAENDDIEYRADYTIRYIRYDNEWVLDYIQRTEQSINVRSFVKSDVVKNDVQAASSDLFNKYGLTNIVMDEPIIEESESTDSSGAPYVSYLLNCSAENTEAAFDMCISAVYKLDMHEGWVVEYVEIVDYSYYAKTSPSEAILEKELSKRNGVCALVSEEKVSENKYVYTYFEEDNVSCDDLSIKWIDTFTFEFDLNNGWYVSDSQFIVEELAPNFAGTWQYKKGGEFFTMTVKNATSEKIVLEDIDVVFIETHVWGKEQTGKVSSGNRTITREWTYEYEPEDMCFVFETEERLLEMEWDGGLSTEKYYLEYRAYINEENGISGFYIDGRHIEKIS